jgi:hypothetical protein
VQVCSRYSTVVSLHLRQSNVAAQGDGQFLTFGQRKKPGREDDTHVRDKWSVMPAQPRASAGMVVAQRLAAVLQSPQARLIGTWAEHIPRRIESDLLVHATEYLIESMDLFHGFNIQAKHKVCNTGARSLRSLRAAVGTISTDAEYTDLMLGITLHYHAEVSELPAFRIVPNSLNDD